MAVRARYHTDPAREFEDPAGLVMRWLEDAGASGMPVDPRIWAEDPPRSSYPACIAFRAAAEQGRDAAETYLRIEKLMGP